MPGDESAGQDSNAPATKSGKEAVHSGTGSTARRCFSSVWEEKEAVAGLGNWALICCFEFASAWPEPADEDWSRAGALAVFVAAAVLLAIQWFRASAGVGLRSPALQKRPWALAAHATLVIGCVAWMLLHVAGEHGPQVCAGTATLWSLLSLAMVRCCTGPSPLQAPTTKVAAVECLKGAEEGKLLLGESSQTKAIPDKASQQRPMPVAAPQQPASPPAMLPQGPETCVVFAEQLQTPLSEDRWTPVFPAPLLSDPYRAPSDMDALPATEEPTALTVSKPDNIQPQPPCVEPEPMLPQTRSAGVKSAQLFDDSWQVTRTSTNPAEDECAVKLLVNRSSSAGVERVASKTKHDSEKSQRSSAMSDITAGTDEVQVLAAGACSDAAQGSKSAGTSSGNEAVVASEAKEPDLIIEDVAEALESDLSDKGLNEQKGYQEKRLSVPTLSVVYENSKAQPLPEQFAVQQFPVSMPVSRPCSKDSSQWDVSVASGTMSPDSRSEAQPPSPSASSTAQPAQGVSPSSSHTPQEDLSRSSPHGTHDDAAGVGKPIGETKVEQTQSGKSAKETAMEAKMRELTKNIKFDPDAVELEASGLSAPDGGDGQASRKPSKSAPAELKKQEDQEESPPIEAEALRKACLAKIHRRVVKIGDYIGGARIEELDDILHQPEDDIWLQDIINNATLSSMTPVVYYDSDSDDGDMAGGLAVDGMGNDQFQQLRERMQGGGNKGQNIMPLLLNSFMGSRKNSFSVAPQMPGGSRKNSFMANMLQNAADVSRNASRKNSFSAQSKSVPAGANQGVSKAGSRMNSQQASRAGSRTASRRGSHIAGEEDAPVKAAFDPTAGKRHTLGVASAFPSFSSGSRGQTLDRGISVHGFTRERSVSPCPGEEDGEDEAAGGRRGRGGKRPSEPALLVPGKRHSLPAAKVAGMSILLQNSADEDGSDDQVCEPSAGSTDTRNEEKDDGLQKPQIDAASDAPVFCLPCGASGPLVDALAPMSPTSQNNEPRVVSKGVQSINADGVIDSTTTAVSVPLEDALRAVPDAPKPKARYSISLLGQEANPLSVSVPLEEVEETEEELGASVRVQAQTSEALRSALANHPPEMRLKDLLERGSIGDLSNLSIGDLLRAVGDVNEKSTGGGGSKDSSTYGSGSSASGSEQEYSDEEDEESEEEEPGFNEDVLRALGSQLNMDQASVSEALKLLMMMNQGFQQQHCTCKEGGPHTCMSPAVSTIASTVASAFASISHSLASSKAASKVGTRRASLTGRRTSTDKEDRRTSTGKEVKSTRRASNEGKASAEEDDTAKGDTETVKHESKRDSVKRSKRDSVKRDSVKKEHRRNSGHRSHSSTSPGDTSPRASSPMATSPANSATEPSPTASPTPKMKAAGGAAQRSSLSGSRGSRVLGSVNFDNADAGAGPSQPVPSPPAESPDYSNAS